MKQLYGCLFSFFLVSNLLMGQQLQDRSNFRDISFLWNPAMTGGEEYWEIAAQYRQQWVGFDDAPSTVNIAGQFPILEYNMSLGTFFNYDNLGALSLTTIAGTYAFHLEPNFVRGDRLSIGLLGVFSQLAVNGLNFDVIDEDDTLIPIGENSQFVFNAGFGFYYVSHANSGFQRRRGEKSYFFVGAATNQLLPSNVFFQGVDGNVNYKRAIHANGIIGARILNEGYFIEPYLWVNYATPNIFKGDLGVILELEDSMWGGLALSSNESMTIQAGYIVADGLFNKDGTVRLGTTATINLGNVANDRGVSYGFYFAYRYHY